MSENMLPSVGWAVAETRNALVNNERWNPVVNAMISVTAKEAEQTAVDLNCGAGDGVSSTA